MDITDWDNRSPRNLASLLNRLHLRHMQLLIAIEERGSLNKAASDVGLTQPGASKSLVEIEDALGHKLFLRSTKGLQPTEAGRCALRYARAISSQLVNLTNELGVMDTGHGGRIRIGAIMGAVPFLTDMLIRFMERHPGASVEFIEDTSRELLNLLDRGLLDLAIGRSTVSDQPGRYASVAVRDETLAVVANVMHPAMSLRRVELPDLVDSRWIVYSANMPMRLLLEREFAQAGIPFPRNLVETRSAFTTLSLIQRNRNFVALLSSDVAAFCSNFDLAAILPIQLYSRSQPYELMTLKGVPLSSLAQKFISELRDDVRATGDSPLPHPSP